MKRFGIISTAVLFCLVGTTAPADALQEQQDTKLTKHEEQAKPEKRKDNKQPKAEQQRQEHTQQQQEQQQRDRAQQRLTEGNVKSELAGIDPPSVGYRELRKALSTYMRLAIEDDGERLPMPTDMGYPGPPYPGFIRLTRLLRLLGDLPDDYSVATASSKPTILLYCRPFGTFKNVTAFPQPDTWMPKR